MFQSVPLKDAPYALYASLCGFYVPLFLIVAVYTRLYLMGRRRFRQKIRKATKRVDPTHGSLPITVTRLHARSNEVIVPLAAELAIEVDSQHLIMDFEDGVAQ